MSQIIAEPAIVRPASLEIADMDGDGDQDLVIASDREDGIRWFANDGTGEFDSSGRSAEIISETPAIQHIQVLDMDGDGDQDVVAASYDHDIIVWYDNLGDGKFGTGQLMTDSIVGPTSFEVVDLDGDGDFDLLVASVYSGTAYRVEKLNDDDRFGQPVVLFEDPFISDVTVKAIPANAEFELQILVFVEGNVHVYELDSVEPVNQFPRSILTPVEFIVEDADADGDLDLWIVGSDLEYATSQELFSRGNFGFSEASIPRDSQFRLEEEDFLLLNQETYPLSDLEFADLDGDQMIEMVIVSPRNHLVASHEKERRGFGPRVELLNNGVPQVTSILAGDVTGDSRLDLFANSSLDREIVYFPNRESGEFGAEIHAIEYSRQVDVPQQIAVLDLDGDQLNDLVAPGSVVRDVFELVIPSRWRNDGSGGFGTLPNADDTSMPKSSLHVTDINSNGTADVVGIRGTGSFREVVWMEGAQQGVIVFEGTGQESSTVFPSDIDNDGDIDLLVSMNFVAANTGTDSHVFWLENQDGMGTFGPARLVTDQAAGTRSVHASDIDGDGDADVVLSATLDGTLQWYENDGGVFSGTAKFITRRANLVHWLHSADMDQDGDIDLVAGSDADRTVTWLENTDGAGTFTTVHEVQTDRGAVSDVIVFDADQDGDPDIATASRHDGRIVLYRNDVEAAGLPGDVTEDGTLDVRDIDALCEAVRSNQHRDATDLNGNGVTDQADLDRLLDDILGIGPGDANLDGRFDSADLVLVFQHGQYEDGIENNSGWAEGDWNCDGEFSTADLVTAFQDGKYVAAAIELQGIAAARDNNDESNNDESKDDESNNDESNNDESKDAYPVSRANPSTADDGPPLELNRVIALDLIFHDDALRSEVQHG